MIASPQANEIRIIRVYNAPAAIVWEAWTDPAQVAQWWGPRGFTLTTHSKDLRPGGIWHYTMHGPDGTDYPNKTLYYEVVEGKKLVYDHGGCDEREPLFRVTVLFSEKDGKTTMTMTMAFPNAERAASIGQFIKQVGGNSTWDRLAEYVGKTVEHRNSFVIARSFDAPREILFRMWTQPDHFRKWLPPKGFDMEILSGAIQAGGELRYRMTDHRDVVMYGRLEYRTITPLTELVYEQEFCDEAKQRCRHPKLPVWPASMVTTVLFADEGSDQSRVTVTWNPAEGSTDEEIQAFLDHRPDMTQGWTGSFDKLEALLAE